MSISRASNERSQSRGDVLRPSADARQFWAEDPGLSVAVLQLKGLSKIFGGLLAVEALDMSVAPGEIRGLIGPNGSGKTTTLNLVSGLYTPTRGEILLDGVRINRLRPSDRTRLGMARTFQNIRLFPRLKVLDNVAMARHARSRAGLLSIIAGAPGARDEEREIMEHARKMLDLVGLTSRANDSPADLPYGAQRLLEIARALATEPKLLLLDEPAAGMNPREKGDLVRLIGRINRELGVTIILIEHDMKVVMTVCHQITVLNFGAKIAEGAVDQVRRDPAVIQAYLGKGAEDHA